LPIGNYVVVGVKENNIEASLVCITDLIALTINNKQQLQIDVRTRQGRFVSDAQVFVNNKEAVFNTESKTWWVKDKIEDEAVLKVCAPADTLFTKLEAKDDLMKTIPEQRKYNYQHSGLYKTIHCIPTRIGALFNPKKSSSGRIGARGYIIFNQPKYKPLDTVKFKGYIIDKILNQYKKSVDVYLNYRNRGKVIEQLIAGIRPTPSGSYLGEFVLADSIPIDITCNLIFKTPGKKEIIREYFKIEDYLLDEIGSYAFRSEKKLYFSTDSLRFFASAKDANGLPVMDATAQLILTTNTINKAYQDTLFVADTLYSKEIKLLADGDTKFSIPANALPSADLTINAILIFKNSNNETQEENEQVEYKYHSKEIIVTKEADCIRAVYVENGVAKEKEGEVEMNYDNAVAVHFPCSIKIDPIAEDYTFYTKELTDNDIIVEYFEIDGNYRLHFARTSINDTLGFVLDNPYNIPVYFTVFDGKKVVASGKQSLAQVSWKMQVKNYRKLYKVRWQYVWAGKENVGEENIGLLYKLLDIKITANPNVFPGQKDSIAIDIKDYKGAPAAGVNLSAVSYNNQFNKDIRVPEPPYLARYKKVQYLQHEGFETEELITLNKKYSLGKNLSWVKKFHLDTMTYYKLLLPEDGYFDAVSLVDNFVPQLSVAVVDKAVPQEIYLLYINRELVYYNGVTDSMKYSFPVFPGYVQVGIRLKDKYVEIDSFYVQPNYKHDISFDLNNLPAHSTVTPVVNYWTDLEMNLLERSIWQMENNLLNDTSFLWQENRMVKLSSNREHIAGPFKQSQMQFFNPGNFDIAFMFEPGYRYNLSKQVVRLEKRSLFPVRNKKNYLPDHSITKMILGDTLVAPPKISYPKKVRAPFILPSKNEGQFYQYAFKKSGMATVQFSVPKDTSISYAILLAEDTAIQPLVLHSGFQQIRNLQPGKYILFLVTKNFYTASVNHLVLTGGGTNYIAIDRTKFVSGNSYINQLKDAAEESLIDKNQDLPPNKEQENVYRAPDNAIYTNVGGCAIVGKVVDERGKNPVPFVSVNLKNFNRGVFSDASGNFVLNNIKPGRYILVFSAVGYENAEASIYCNPNENIRLDIVLKVSNQALNEVVVVGYGTMKKLSLAGSISIVKNEELTFNMLSGKVAGVSIVSQSGVSDGDIKLQIRGINTNGGDERPLYVVDGILYDVLPKNFNMENVVDVNVLKDAAATAIYGSRAANGVVVITTKTKTFRKDFRDYAFWQPDLYTDKKGHVSFGVSYPDNITGWRTYVVAMDKNRRMGKASVLTRAYKPIVAQLGLPRFLVEGDSAVVIGKAINYTQDKYHISTAFSINGKQVVNKTSDLLPNDAGIEELMIDASNKDSINAAFTLESGSGFTDGEERKIPVYKKGIEETIGNFWVFKNDTSFSFTSSSNSGEINLFAQHNTLDLLLEELDHLRKYPYSCMEQTASKLTGLAMEKEIRSQLKQPFKNQAEMDKLLKKVQKTQLFDGGWAWWENSKANLQVTNYITRALLRFRANPLVETNVRNAFLYLQNQLSDFDKNELLVSLSTLSEGGHEMNYGQWMNKMTFDSLTLHQQWLWVKIRQQQKMNYQAELQKLVDKKINTMLGGIHWGTENYRWYSNETATTLIAFDVVKNEANFRNLVPGIIQYFLEKRPGGYWANTVETASIVNAVLPVLFEEQANFRKPGSITVSGDTNFVINSFPYQVKLNAATIKNIQVNKNGGGHIYFTAYQRIFNIDPKPVKDKFIIKTSFRKNDQEVTSIKNGEHITMQVSIDVLKDAEYVMIDVPIPAGCTYAAKKNESWHVYKEFYKDRVLIFAESLPNGVQQFEIELEPRYKGSYNLNPAKAELMYFPIFYGRNEMRRVEIIK